MLNSFCNFLFSLRQLLGIVFLCMIISLALITFMHCLVVLFFSLFVILNCFRIIQYFKWITKAVCGAISRQDSQDWRVENDTTGTWMKSLEQGWRPSPVDYWQDPSMSWNVENYSGPRDENTSETPTRLSVILVLDEIVGDWPQRAEPWLNPLQSLWRWMGRNVNFSSILDASQRRDVSWLMSEDISYV